jgi:hypothetical protein
MSKQNPVKKEVPLDDNVCVDLTYCIAVMMVNIILYTVEGVGKPAFALTKRGGADQTYGEACICGGLQFLYRFTLPL